MGDHTECFQVDYDPKVISYEDLLERFWQSHDPTRPAMKTQYESVVLAADAEQLELARESAAATARLLGRTVRTRIELLDRFWLAEDYHQKYYLRGHRELAGELHDAYPEETDFIDSPAAARINGYVFGGGNCARLERDLPGFGLSAEGAAHLRSHCELL